MKKQLIGYCWNVNQVTAKINGLHTPTNFETKEGEVFLKELQREMGQLQYNVVEVELIIKLLDKLIEKLYWINGSE